jgi:predicted  nucleic acid-binding Zn-ribbon protein
MSTALMEQRLTKLDNEITAITTAIEKKEDKLEEERRGENNQDIINDINKSIDRLSTKETTLNTRMDKLLFTINNQSNQGKLQYMS